MESVAMKEARIDARLILKSMDAMAVAKGGSRFRDLTGCEAMNALRAILSDTVDAENDEQFVMATLVAREAVNQWFRELKRLMRLEAERQLGDDERPEIPY